MLTMEVTKLIERCRQGDKDALGELYKAYAQRMRGVCWRYFSDKQTVEDVLHDAFVIIFTSFDKLRDVERAEAWMTAITRNVASKCKDHLKSLPTVSFDETSEAKLSATENEEIDVKGIPLNEVVRMVDRLPDGYGQVFRLSVFEGLSHKEIADILGIESHSSSSQLSRAKKMLRKMMRQYWVAVLLLLLMPLTFLLIRKSDTAISNNDKPTVAKLKEGKNVHRSLSKESEKEPVQEPMIVHLPVQRATTIATETLPSQIAQAVDSIMVDTLSNMVAQEQAVNDTISNDTTKAIRKVELPQYDIANLFPEKPTITTNNKKWSVQLAYAGQFDEQNRYNQQFSYKPTPSNVQSDPSGYEPTIPSSIDNWTDYAIYLANNPDAASAKTRSVIMHIALNNASRPDEDKILRTSHHQMPVTWSLALKYRLNSLFGLESGLNYSRMTSNFEMGADGNAIHEKQTIHYLGIPMKGIYNMYGGKQWGIYGSFGLTTEIPVHSTIYSDFYLNGKYETSDKTTIHAPWQFSTTFGLGLQYHLTPNVGLFAEPSLQYYIPMDTEFETYRTEHPFTLSLPLGIRFTW